MDPVRSNETLVTAYKVSQEAMINIATLLQPQISDMIFSLFISGKHTLVDK
jgi:hypothetical protein